MLLEHLAEIFPPAKCEEIEALALADKPPPRWLTFELFQLESRAWYEWHWIRGIDPTKRREKIPSALRRRVIERDGYRCQLCGDEVSPEDIHLDHKVPRIQGGPDTFSNLQVAHSVCNLRKGARLGTS